MIAQPSAATAERFNLNKVHERNVAIVDRPDKQGVTVEGEAEPAESVVLVLLKALPDMIVREITLPNFLEEQRSGKFSLQTGFLSFDVEFPYGSKIFLDSVRSQVAATINNHHLLKIIDPETVDVYETLLRSEPERNEDLKSRPKETDPRETDSRKKPTDPPHEARRFNHKTERSKNTEFHR